MVERDNQLTDLRELLQDGTLRQRIQAEADQFAVVRLVIDAGAEKGYRFDESWLKEAFDDIRLVRPPRELTEPELIAVGSPNSTNRLCHTDSCMHGGPRCCP
jgi:hypothetical protein